MIEETKFIADEHPEGDKFQLMMLGVFLSIWVTDSFVIRSVFRGSITPIYLVLGAVIVLCGGYLVNESHKLVIDSDEHRLVDWGVYTVARHPMYLGIMLVYLGLTVSTGSAASLLILFGVFYVYDRIADYEENRLTETLGDEYRVYRENVRRWSVI